MFEDLPCIRCGERDNLLIHLSTEEFHCNECDGDFSREEVEAALNTWRRVLAWLDTVPKGGGECTS